MIVYLLILKIKSKNSHSKVVISPATGKSVTRFFYAIVPPLILGASACFVYPVVFGISENFLKLAELNLLSREKLPLVAYVFCILSYKAFENRWPCPLFGD